MDIYIYNTILISEMKLIKCIDHYKDAVDFPIQVSRRGIDHLSQNSTIARRGVVLRSTISVPNYYPLVGLLESIQP